MDTDRRWKQTVSDPAGSPSRPPAEAERERDALLVERVAARAKNAADTAGAIAELFDRHAPLVLGLLERMLGAGGEAEEVLQEVFLQVWRQAHHYRPRLKSVRGWLLLLARSRALDRLRSTAARQRREDQVGKADGGRSQPPVGSGRLERDERRRRLAAALERLPAEQRQAVELAFFAGLTHAQIAERLGAPLGTVKSRVLLGLKKLRHLLVGDSDARFPAAAA